MIQTDTVRSFSHREARDVLGSRPPFVIQGVLRNSINLVFGVSENGKSTVATSMVAAMINGDTHWLGREIQPGMTALISAGLCGLCARSVTLAGFTGTPDICYDCKDVQWRR